MLVLLQHTLANLAPPRLAAIFSGNEMGSIAVLIFFALSGFVITEAAEQLYLDRPIAFLTNRLLRIVPHFLIAVVLSIAIHYAFSKAGTLRLSQSSIPFSVAAFGAKNILLNLLSCFPGMDRGVDYGFLEIAWAIRVEMAFYLVIGLCLALVKVATHFGFRIGLGTTIVSAGLALAPLVPFAVFGRLLPMLQFLPYFAFGCALYFGAVKRERVGFLVSAIALPAMAAQFLSLPARHPVLGFERAVELEFVELAFLLGLLTILALSRTRRFKAEDRYLGDLTYPLYLYHQDVIIAVLSLTASYSYGSFGAANIASVLMALALRHMLDPLMGGLRDRVRGRDLRKRAAPVLLGDTCLAARAV
jgi:peptidoglycan/LPS O-acetylase OafA/YrhL